MMPIRITASVLGVMLCAGLSAAQETTSTAQTSAQPPAQTAAQTAAQQDRLFTDPDQLLGRAGATLALSIFDAYDWTTLKDQAGAQLPSAGLPAVQQSGQHPGASAVLRLTKQRNHTYLDFGGSSTLNYYKSADTTLVDGRLSAQESTQIGRHTTISSSQWFSYAPYYSFGAFPDTRWSEASGAAPVTQPGFDLAVTDSPVYTYAASVGLSRPLSDRSTISATYLVDRMDVRDTDLGSTFQMVGGNYTQRLSRNVGYHLGYWYAQTAPTSSLRPTTNMNNIDIGIDVQSDQSRTRKTTFSISTGSSIASQDPSRSAPSGAPSHSSVQLVGRASVQRDLGHMWKARGTYQHDWGTFQGFDDPLDLDRVAFDLSGPLSRRTTTVVNALYLHGNTPSLQYGAPSYQAWSATARVQVAVNRRLAAFGQANYYTYDLRSPPVALIGVPDTFDRSSVRVGLVLVAATARQ